MKMTNNRRASITAIALAAALLAACASPVQMPSAAQVDGDAKLQAASNWHAPLPHGGSTAQLLNWWTQLGDSLLNELMQAAQANNANMASALTRIAQARAGVAQAEQATGLNTALAAQATRAVQQPQAPIVTSASLGLQASWELDLWGGNQAALSAARQRQRQAELGWHEARVAVAAEMASVYLAYRYCESLLAVLERDAASRAETARLAQLSAQAGFAAPATAQLARASSFDAGANLAATQAQCDAQVKALVALSGMAEPDVRQKLKANQAQALKIAGQSALFSIANAVPVVPAQLLAQRPDIASAQIGVTAAAQELRSADARRYPSLSLTGSIGAASARQLGVTQDGATWSLGPISLSLPLSGQSAIRSNTQAAVAAYEEAVAQLRSRSRQAVREVEESLVNLNAAKLRAEQSQQASQAYAASLAATQARYRAGLASLVELEDARRTALYAQQSELAVERDRIAAWIALYRATGGGWTPASEVAAQASSSTQR
jgi:outer membrane protein, multidrug efflux system